MELLEKVETEKTKGNKIAVDNTGKLWMVNIYGEIHYLFNGQTERLTGRASDIVTGPKAKLYILTRKSQYGRNRGLGKVKVLQQGKWVKTSLGLRKKFTKFAVGPHNLFMGLKRGGKVVAF